MEVCTRCGAHGPFAPHRRICLNCKRAEQRENATRYRDRVAPNRVRRPKADPARTCTECGKYGPIDARELCHSCYQKAWRKEHPEQFRAITKRAKAKQKAAGKRHSGKREVPTAYNREYARRRRHPDRPPEYWEAFDERKRNKRQ